MPHYKLTYFNGRGRAEVARMMFAIAGAEYEDNRISFDDWPKLKPDTPFGQMPLLEVGGKMICQSNTINRYVARQFGFAGKTPWEEAEADMMVDCVDDVANSLFAIARSPDDAQTKEKRFSEFMTEEMPALLASFEKILSENHGGGGYFVGDSMTWADINFTVIMDWLEVRLGVQTDWSGVPKLNALKARVLQHPKIVEWIEKRPQTQY